MNREAALLVERLGLTPHPEGGYYRENYRAHSVARAVLLLAFTSYWRVTIIQPGIG